MDLVLWFVPRLIHGVDYRTMVLSSMITVVYIKTHGSESRGQEEAGLRDERVSYLQVAPLWNLLTL